MIHYTPCANIWHACGRVGSPAVLFPTFYISLTCCHKTQDILVLRGQVERRLILSCASLEKFELTYIF